MYRLAIFVLHDANRSEQSSSDAKSHAEQRQRIPDLENTDIITDPLLLVLGYTLCDPRNVSYLLCACQPRPVHQGAGKGFTCSLSFTQA